jgi:hypothetical protein
VGSGTVPNQGTPHLTPTLSAPKGGEGGCTSYAIQQYATEGDLRVTTYFCDGLREVSVVNGVARLEFHRLEAVQRGGNRELQPTAEFTIALPLQGFIQALGVLENVRARFAEQGLIGAPGSPEGNVPPSPMPTKSPNFP